MHYVLAVLLNAIEPPEGVESNKKIERDTHMSCQVDQELPKISADDSIVPMH